MNNRLDVNVVCPIDSSIKTVYIESICTEEDKPFFFPCNGCDSMNGSKTCQKCTAAITTMFTNGYRPKTGEPTIPYLQSLR